VELRHLRYFVAVAEELHFRRAAERLHVAQPAISEQIRKLEQELGVRLFDRTHRTVSMTVAGEALLEEARRVLRQADVARQAAQTARDRATMRLGIGYLPTSLTPPMCRALRHLATSAPAVKVVFQTATAQRLIDELRAERLDIVITNTPAATRGLRVHPLGQQSMVAVLPLTHPAAHAGEVSLARLAPEQLVMLPREADPVLHSAVLALCHQAALAPRLVELAEPSVEHAVLSVAAGAGVAILPDAVADRHAIPGVRFVGLAEGGRAIAAAALTHPDAKSIAIQAFLHALARSPSGARSRELVSVAAA
jgi:DNA-binding transcriptional LysR family regulator